MAPAGYIYTSLVRLREICMQQGMAFRYTNPGEQYPAAIYISRWATPTWYIYTPAGHNSVGFIYPKLGMAQPDIYIHDGYGSGVYKSNWVLLRGIYIQLGMALGVY